MSPINYKGILYISTLHIIIIIIIVLICIASFFQTTTTTTTTVSQVKDLLFLSWGKSIQNIPTTLGIMANYQVRFFSLLFALRCLSYVFFLNIFLVPRDFLQSFVQSVLSFVHKEPSIYVYSFVFMLMLSCVFVVYRHQNRRNKSFVSTWKRVE